MMADLKKIGMKMWLAGLTAVCICVFCTFQASAEGSAAGNAAAGIVEVQSGFLDAKGKFWKMKSGSGFLIANKDNEAYMVTNCSNVSNTPRTIKKYCRKHSIDTENMQFSNNIRVVVKGDVTAQAQVVVQSEEKDYCILSTGNVVSQKKTLKLGDSAGIARNDLVYAYGFPKETGTETEPMEYSEMDVRSMQGTVIKKEEYLNDGVYIAHSVPAAPGYEGGALLDADGYVIGVNCSRQADDDAGVSYALPINEVCAVLDNFSIYYASRGIDEAHAALETAYQECTKIQAAGGYKKESMEALEQALAAAGEALQQEEPYASDLREACQALTDAVDQLVPKMEILTTAIIVLSAVNGMLFLWMLVLAVINAKEKKKMQAGSRMQPQGAARQRQSAVQDAARQGQSAVQDAARQGRHTASSAGGRIRLVRQKSGQVIAVSKNQFVIGKSQQLADFGITDNQKISRKHAVLFESNGRWHIDDLNSLNGTYLNGIKVVPGQAQPLKEGDEIVLSDEVFFVQG